MSDQLNDLERMLSDKNSEPKALPLSLLKEITNSFSDEQEIGRGGFAVVYKGMLKDGVVAVKRLHNSHLHEDKFERELECLIKVKHINVVRFLGHCADTQKIAANYSGKFVLAEELQRLLCFEYLPKGSLCDYITALEWTKCYLIIEGICQGLNYLHENNIVHSDMKPANILLDSNMIPKIADFGLSECFDENQALEVIGSRGYMAPEYGRKEIPFKYDIYSLGVIIIEIITGERGHPDIENVLQSWNDKLEISQRDIQLEQIRVCTQIGISCTRFDPTKRPDMKHIIDMLDKRQAENASGELQQDKSGLHKMPLETCLETTQETGPCAVLLDIHPLELRFPFRPNELITCPAYLKNITDHHVVFRLQLGSQAKRYYHDWLCGNILPGSTYTLNVTMKERKKPPPSHEDKVLIIQSTVISHEELHTITEGKGDIDYVNFFTKVQEKGIGKVHEQKLTAVCDKHGATKTKIIPMSDYNKILCMDVHPTKPWIITSHFKGPFRIWDHEIKNMVHEGPGEREGMSFWTAKFIERKQWLVAGGDDGCIYMYNYNTMEKVKSLKAHRHQITSLAIHPTKPYVMSVSKSHNIKLWDWEEDQKSAQTVQTFEGHSDSVSQLAFNPKDADTFATVSKDKTIKIWSLDSPHYIVTIPVLSSNVTCLDYFTRDNEQYLITGSKDGTAKIWDLQKKCCIEKLDGHTKKVTTVCYHPMLQLLVTGSWDGTVRLWNANSFRLEGIHNFGLQKVHALGRILKGSGRVLIGYRCGLAIMAHEEHVASNSENTM